MKGTAQVQSCTVQYNTVEYSSAHYITVLYSTVRLLYGLETVYTKVDSTNANSENMV